MIGIGLLISPISFSYAKENIQESNKIQVKLDFDENLVDKPIEDLKKEDIIIEKDEDGNYVVIIIDQNGDKKKQVVTEDEAKDLGYIEDVVNNPPKDKEIIVTKDEDDNYYIIIIDEDGNEIKQVITEEEAMDLGYVEDIKNIPIDAKVSIKKEGDRYILTITYPDGRVIKQVISANEAFALGYTDKDEVNVKESDQTGLPLNKTATNMYDLLLIGGLLIISGSFLFFIKRKRENIKTSS